MSVSQSYSFQLLKLILPKNVCDISSKVTTLQSLTMLLELTSLIKLRAHSKAFTRLVREGDIPTWKPIQINQNSSALL